MLKWTLALKYTKTNSKNSFIWLQKISAMCLWIISKYIFRKSKQYWLFPNSYQLVSTLSENYFQAILTFSEFISDIHFQGVNTHNSKKFCRVHIKQYRQFKRVDTTYTSHFFAEFVSNNTDIFKELLAENTTFEEFISNNIDIFLIPTNGDIFKKLLSD